MQRREVNYRGRVQGVGFRYTTQRIASDYAVGGFVLNLPDGSVQVVAEGEESELDKFFAELARVMQDHIRDCRVNSTAATGEFSSFEIRH